MIGDWIFKAACRDVPTAVFYPEPKKGPGGPDLYREAKAICDGCPVKQACLDHALDNDERWGVWGGLSPNQRDAIMRQRKTRVRVAEHGSRQMYAKGCRCEICVESERAYKREHRRLQRRGSAA